MCIARAATKSFSFNLVWVRWLTHSFKACCKAKNAGLSETSTLAQTSCAIETHPPLQLCYLPLDSVLSMKRSPLPVSQHPSSTHSIIPQQSRIPLRHIQLFHHLVSLIEKGGGDRGGIPTPGADGVRIVALDQPDGPRALGTDLVVHFDGV